MDLGHAEETGSVDAYRVGDVAVIVLNRPGRHNAVGTPMLTHLREQIVEAGLDAGAIVLASEGRHFCVGADLGEVASAWGRRGRIRSFLSLFHEVADTIAASPVPVIAAVQGFALAGGLELALACDLIVAADGAEFGDQHVKVDLIPGGGGSQRLPRAIGARRALALQLTGIRIDVDRALAWGLVHSRHSQEALRPEAIVLATEIASRNRVAVGRIRELAGVAATQSLQDGLRIELATATDYMSNLEPSDALRAFARRGTSGVGRTEPGQPGSGDRRGS